MSEPDRRAKRRRTYPSPNGPGVPWAQHQPVRPFLFGLLLLVPLCLSACRDTPDTPFLCNPDFITADGECDEPWYDATWQQVSQWAKDTLSQYAGDFLGIDFKQELENRLAASQVFTEARNKLRQLQATELPSLSVGSLMRVVQDPGSLDVLADFLRHGGPSAYELYSRAIDEGGPYLDQLRSLLEDFARSHGFKEQEIAPLIVDAIARYRGDSFGAPGGF